jgi:hypothetical protein
MVAWWFPVPAGGRAPSSRFFLCFARFCVFLGEIRRRLLSEDGIRFPPPSLRSNDVPSVVGGGVEVCLWWISSDLASVCLRWIRLDPIVVRLRLCVRKLEASDLCISSSAAVAVLVRWSSVAVARRLPDCLLQQDSPGSDHGGVMAAARLRLALVSVVVARWSSDLDVILIASGVLCIALIVDE